MTRKTLLLLSCMAVALSPASPILTPLMAQAPDGPGFTVTQVDAAINGDSETFRNAAKGSWVRTSGSGQIIARYTEAGRDEWSVYLSDETNPQLFVQLDLFTKKIIQQPRGGARVDIGQVVSSAATPIAAARVTTPAVQAPLVSAPQGNAADDEFNPFADPQPASPAPQPSPTPTASGNQASSLPPWLRNQSNAASGNAGSGTVSSGSATQMAMANAAPFDGPWVEANKSPQASGDGVSGPISWTLPEAIWISSAGGAGLTLHFDRNPAGSVSLGKTGENQYAGGGYRAVFSPLGTRYRLSLSGNGASRTFDMSTTVEKDLLSRDRFDASLRTEVENRRSTFTQGGQVKGWNTMFHSFKGEDMDLFTVTRGRKTMIFKQPGPRDIANDDNVNKSLVFGLRGQPTLNTSSQQLETVITNSASYQKSMSYNFGGGGGGKGASLGVNVSREETKGSESSSETSRAYGLGRVETFILWLDKPNIELDPGFKDDILQLSRGAMSAADFRNTYGTHYAAAIHYGGIGEATRTVTSKEMRDFVSQSTSVSAEGSVKAVQLKGGFTDASNSSTGGKSMFSQSSWRATGGAGSMTENGWTVTEDNSVPIRYDLRPLSELISPLFFAAEWDTPQRAALLSARQQLDAEITRHLASQPPLADRRIGPAVYRLTFHSIKCLSNGDDGTGPAQLYGKIKASVFGLDGTQDMTLFDALEDNPKSVSCNGGAEFPVDKTTLVTSARGGNDMNKLASFIISADQLFEYDPSAVDYDEAIVNKVPTPLILKDWTATTPRTDLPGTALGSVPGQSYAPDLRVRVSFQPLQ